MISPLGQRQILATAALEAIRVAHAGGVQAQQDVARRQSFVDRLVEGHDEVQQVEHADGLRLDPDHPRERREGGGTGPHGEPGTEEEAPEEGAASAEGHLDFLA